ncbi:MBL fold metallo-hydrolase RNA specificity domain-containing protein [Microbacterium thalassium]|uniref:Metallo-beta-lactamase family protein n=1 Tax=Microbacterium thalassium TaxID=362649 RepID=A0A7X0FR79_9MICO|nr:MBL fold metallo-hydrolase [Microbacterium thalassium]MBB6391616.1 metallo-beta-lactamase family protein [Microbacterium thalassium]GLK24219.1 MBL fold hydrolase [Microbacterium thalassium]
MTARLTFHGAVDTVTGSRYLIEAAGRRVLVDCGLFQGFKALRLRNREPFPVDPRTIDAVVITHAHLDHTGYLPALVKQGFAGEIHSTVGTAELSGLILPDSGYLMEEEAAYHRRRGSSKHADPQPLYTRDDAEAAVGRFVTHGFDDPVDLDGVRVTFVPAGHILGAAQLQIQADGRRLHFTGDLGRADDALMRPPRPLEATDLLVCESTYGDRDHSTDDPGDELAAVIHRICTHGGVVLIPAFAVGRAESLLLQLSRLRAAGRIPDVPVFLNSPMAVNAAEIYERHREEHRIADDEFRRMYDLPTFVRTVDESKLLNLRGGPMIIISASGMLEGGRVLHHLMAYGGDRHNAIILTGFQAGGTRGATLQRGERVLRMFGENVPIRAEVHDIGSLSAHADRRQILEWMQTAPEPPGRVFLTHGEPAAADALRQQIAWGLGWDARVPRLGETVEV